MALQIKHNGYTPDWQGRDLLLPAQGLDTYDTVWGGTVSYDFARSDTPALAPNVVRNGDTIQSLRTGAGPITAVQVQGGGTTPWMQNNHSAQGLDLSTSQYNNLRLPDALDLLTLGDKPSVVIWAMFKCVSVPASSRSLIFHGRLSQGAYSQWVMNHGVTANFGMQIGSAGGKTDIGYAAGNLVAGTEYLASLFVQKISDTQFTAHSYLNGTKLGTATRAYPFNDPTDYNLADVPSIGISGGTSGVMSCVLRRMGRRQVDPDSYTVADHEAWIAEQIAANAARWA